MKGLSVRLGQAVIVALVAVLILVDAPPAPSSAATSEAPAPGPVAEVVVDNGPDPGRIRFDTNGNAIDAHDGEIVQFGNRYYLYGTAYGCGYYRFSRPATPFCGFRVYESGDLTTWTDRGLLFDPGPWQTRCNSLTLSCYRPHVIRHPTTGQYMLWFNGYDVPNGYHVFTSESPTGPFVEVGVPNLVFPNGGDFDLFTDEDSNSYIAYTIRPGYGMAVERLDPSLTTGTGQVVDLGLSKVEAPSLFRRSGVYYLTISDPGCAYCAGTGTSYFTAERPLGPWVRTGRISETSCGGQPAAVAELRSQAGTTYLYQSDRWNHRSPNQALARHHWEPLQFAPDGTILPLTCAPTHTVALDAPAPDPYAPHVDPLALAAMTWSCDIAGRRSRAQTLRIKRTTKVHQLSLIAFRRFEPRASLRVSLHRATRGRPVGKALWRGRLPAGALGWAPQHAELKVGKRLRRGTYVVVLSTRAKASRGKCYGTVVSVGAAPVAGTALVRAKRRWKRVEGDHGLWARLA